MGAIITGTVMRIMVEMLEAPEMRAASSIDWSMFRKAGVNSMTLYAIPSPISFAQTMPWTL